MLETAALPWQFAGLIIRSSVMASRCSTPLMIVGDQHLVLHLLRNVKDITTLMCSFLAVVASHGNSVFQSLLFKCTKVFTCDIDLILSAELYLWCIFVRPGCVEVV